MDKHVFNFCASHSPNSHIKTPLIATIISFFFFLSLFYPCLFFYSSQFLKENMTILVEQIPFGILLLIFSFFIIIPSLCNNSNKVTLLLLLQGHNLKMPKMCILKITPKNLFLMLDFINLKMILRIHYSSHRKSMHLAIPSGFYYY